MVLTFIHVGLSLVWLGLFVAGMYRIDSRVPQRVYDSMYLLAPAALLALLMCIVSMALLDWLPLGIWLLLQAAAWSAAVRALNRWQTMTAPDRKA